MFKIAQPTLAVDASSGLIDDQSVGKALLPKNAVMKAINVLFDRPRGAISQRSGTTKIATVSNGNTILGLHDFRSSVAASRKLLAAATTVIYSSTGGSFTSRVTGLTTGLKTRFLTYLDTVVFMNGTDASQSSTNGTAWVSTGGNLDVANFPKATSAATLNTRVITVGDPAAPDTAYLSSLVSAGAISWTAGNKSVQVSPNDGGGGLTGVVSNGRLALLFKERGLYRYDDNELQRIGYVGTPSYESIATDDNGFTYFFGQGANGVGFYRTTGGFPEKLSRPITRYVEAISPAFYANVNGYTDGTRVYWSVGSLTIGDYTYTNAWLVFSIADRVWTVFDLADRYRVFSQYIDSSGNMTVVSGDTDGDVQTVNSGNTDNTTAIFSECELSPIVFTTRSRIKEITEVCTYAEHFQGLNFLMRVDDGRFENFGSIDRKDKYFKGKSMRGHEFFPKITAVNSGTPWQFTGLEFPANSVMDEGNF
jgi:hypothetical protein